MTQKREFMGYKLAQRGDSHGVQCFAFIANSRDVLQWAGIRRAGEDENGTQRILRETKVKQIQRYFEVNQDNIIPTSVILAFEPGTAKFTSLEGKLAKCLKGVGGSLHHDQAQQWGILSFEFDESAELSKRPALIVDGQHRLHGMSEIEPPLSTLIVAILDATREEQAFHFVVINNKADKVPTDNVKAIISMSDADEDNLTVRLVKAGVNYGKISAILRLVDQEQDSPFYHLLDWPLNSKEDRVVKLTTIESCLRPIRMKLTNNNEDDAVQIFLSIWKSVYNQYENLWRKNDKFMSKVNIQAINEYIVDIIESISRGGYIDVFEPNQIMSQTEKLLKPFPSQFWQLDWTYELQDNAVIRDNIKRDFDQMARNTNPRTAAPWYHSLRSLSEEVKSQLKAEEVGEDT